MPPAMQIAHATCNSDAAPSMQRACLHESKAQRRRACSGIISRIIASRCRFSGADMSCVNLRPRDRVCCISPHAVASRALRVARRKLRECGPLQRQQRILT